MAYWKGENRVGITIYGSRDCYDEPTALTQVNPHEANIEWKLAPTGPCAETATTHPLDQYRDPAQVTKARRLAAEVAAEIHGQNLHEVWPTPTPMEQQQVIHQLWESAVVALLDFEFAVLGPVEINLCRLVCEARVSDEGERVDSPAGAAAVEIAARHMDPIHGRALIHGAVVFDQLRDFGIWLVQDDLEERVEDWRTTRLLTDLLDGEGDYLASPLG